MDFTLDPVDRLSFLSPFGESFHAQSPPTIRTRARSPACRWLSLASGSLPLPFCISWPRCPKGPPPVASCTTAQHHLAYTEPGGRVLRPATHRLSPVVRRSSPGICPRQTSIFVILTSKDATRVHTLSPALTQFCHITSPPKVH